ncbi:MAG: isocitrate/isopropylmalate dehydrogenase family protein [Planctomycetota bacterium]
MSAHRIAVLPGDGIGPEVCTAAQQVLESAGLDAEWVGAPVGWTEWCERGEPLPPATLELIRETRACLFGAITSKPAAEASAELVPALRDRGLTYRSPIVRLRQELGLHTCARPCRSLPGVPGAFEGVDIVVFRENSEGEYLGVEFNGLPACVANHERSVAHRNLPGGTVATSCRVVSEAACERICTGAFDFARAHGRRHVTLLEKANVLRTTGEVMVRSFRRVADRYPEIETREEHIDAACMHAVRDPARYDVVVAGNLFGDIFSDLAAGLVGGLGFAPSANTSGPRSEGGTGVFEPTHGSAPDIAGKNLANPIGCVLAGAMLAEWLGERPAAERVRTGVEHVLTKGDIRTPDMGGTASTDDMTEALARACAAHKTNDAITAPHDARGNQ